MKSKYVDISACLQVIGCVYKNPSLLGETDKYNFHTEDFPDSFQRICFGAIHNLWNLGAKEISLITIEDYLSEKPKALAEYQANKGSEYLLKCADAAQDSAFDYYYGRMKKMTLMRMYQEQVGMDLSWLYDPDNLFDAKKKQQQEEYIDNCSLENLAKIIDDKIESIKAKYVDNIDTHGVAAAEGLRDLISSFKESPELGYPLYGKYMNTVTRGARLKKFYLRSAATGVGKTRSMIADACYIGCSQMYDLDTNRWITTGCPEPTIYIATEQELSEVQTMMIAFLSAVDEEHILNSEYLDGETERVEKAIQILENGKIIFYSLPDFSLQDIENTIKQGIRDYDAKYVMMDYIHTSMKILEEVTRRSGGVRLREDNILFMISIRLKDLCNQYDIFIMSATQLNASYLDSEEPDQNLLRGAKSIADKIDWGGIMLEVSPKDREVLQPLCQQLGIEMPNVKLSVYKNRRGRWKGIYLWMRANRGICRFDPIFVTNYRYEIQDMIDFKIHVKEEMAF